MHMPLQDTLGINLLAANSRQAEHNRSHFDAWGTLCLNVMSSPGAGKTSLLERSLPVLARSLRMAVLEGDMTTRLDAERLEATGIPVVPITTGRACHLDAAMVSGGLKLLRQRLNPEELDLLWVENVGNLVCPAEFEVGEHLKVALLSVTEGEDKPLKYPVMFREADCVLITKVDLLPHLPLDVAALERNIHSVNPEATVLQLSAINGRGFDLWHAWIERQRSLQAGSEQPAALAAGPR
ncbi:hydrogenase accessory protein HypB [Synechococcus sp. RSCCF101]|uniref:hydrogenase nickel incorporation protein HypB n=1 Tax=Synechococcus sp. RSCCF101 TaxID=2511069 RepID=UPI0012488682|nr:hydrogenase nickel incorporation protein HypB [Synechococcus sp. RSCCF101]QEY31912.1 hydrogenase accessory protein HypB [Synechococcus sp. RSCCF101]